MNKKDKELIQTELFKEIITNDIKGVEKALKNGADVNLNTEFFKHTPLYEAVENVERTDKHFKRADIAKMLIDNGADIDEAIKIARQKTNYKALEILTEFREEYFIKTVTFYLKKQYEELKQNNQEIQKAFKELKQDNQELKKTIEDLKQQQK